MTDPSQALAWLKALDEGAPSEYEDAVLTTRLRNVLPQLIGVVSASARLNACISMGVDGTVPGFFRAESEALRARHDLDRALTALAVAVEKESK